MQVRVSLLGQCQRDWLHDLAGFYVYVVTLVISRHHRSGARKY